VTLMIAYQAIPYPEMFITKLLIKKYSKLINNFIALVENVAEEIRLVCSNFHKGFGELGREVHLEGKSIVIVAHMAKESDRDNLGFGLLEEEMDGIFLDFVPLESVCSVRGSFDVHQ
jgi:hypothetical protein